MALGPGTPCGRRVVLVVLGLALTSPPVEGQHLLQNSESSTQISGYLGTVTHLEVPQAGSGKAIYGIAWDEHRDHPCRLYLDSRDLANGDATDMWSVQMEICPPGGEATDWGASYRSIDFQAHPRYYIRGIAVCANSGSNHRMKGVRIYPSRVLKEEARIVELDRHEEGKLPNCGNDEWDDPVFCPDGKVAFGLVVHSLNNAVRGLGLRCKRVVWPEPELSRLTVMRQAGALQTDTDVSGFRASGLSGGITRLDAGDRPLYGMAWAEENDQPCLVFMFSRALTNGNDVRSEEDHYRYCVGSPGVPSLGGDKQVLFDQNPRYFIRGIAICANDGNHRMKGIRIYPARVRMRQRTVEPLDNYAEEKRSNCGRNEWRTARFCPDNQVAFGLNIHRGGYSITGMGLRCRPVNF